VPGQKQSTGSPGEALRSIALEIPRSESKRQLTAFSAVNIPITFTPVKTYLVKSDGRARDTAGADRQRSYAEARSAWSQAKVTAPTIRNGTATPKY